ncbi:hypothetical protein VTK73DRAFT_7346 [Phialemonium thermophilum]|uniref:Uncharacterized protein n=1 Tax=Phialemonium thermophilum TaxID=223376 RepID=A0ABR3WFM9_9PEZI
MRNTPQLRVCVNRPIHIDVRRQGSSRVVDHAVPPVVPIHHAFTLSRSRSGLAKHLRDFTTTGVTVYGDREYSESCTLQPFFDAGSWCKSRPGCLISLPIQNELKHSTMRLYKNGTGLTRNRTYRVFKEVAWILCCPKSRLETAKKISRN